jgi:hypothetical protein
MAAQRILGSSFRTQPGFILVRRRSLVVTLASAWIGIRRDWCAGSRVRGAGRHRYSRGISANLE